MKMSKSLHLVDSFTFQVKATAGNVDGAVRELPDANLVKYITLIMKIYRTFVYIYIICLVNLHSKVPI
jgi:hypothetical protein